MFKKLLLMTVLAVMAMSPAALMAQAEIINGFDADSFKPFAYMDENGVPIGFDIDCVNWIAQKKGLTVSHQPYAWDSIIELLQNKNINMIASGLSVTPERAERVAFTIPYWSIKQVVLVAKDSALTLDEVLTGGKKIGLQLGTSDLASMDSSNGQNGRKYETVGYTSVDLAAEDVINGRIDAVVMNDDRGFAILKNQPLKFLGYAGIPDEDFAYAVSKDDAELLNALNEGLQELMTDPAWKELIAKYELDQKL
ncbi:MAG: ABC transporter substrate-binding protein [Deltaproteobacteria bacterium]|nr:ABC transporter substrate-binding protein [Deltaproteobacteria bacterium]